MREHVWDGDTCLRCGWDATDAMALAQAGATEDPCRNGVDTKLLDKVYDLWHHGDGSDGPSCQRCGLFMEANQVVVGSGDPGPGLLIIGEAPGANEDMHGTPFVGAAGVFLRDQAQLAGVDLGSVTFMTPERYGGSIAVTSGEAYWTNIVGCRPPDNRTPTRQEASACRGRLDGIVAGARPKAILALGNTPLLALLGLTGITKARGQWVDCRWTWRGESWTVPVMPTFHPSGLVPGRIRNPGDLDLFRADIRAAYDRATKS